METTHVENAAAERRGGRSPGPTTLLSPSLIELCPVAVVVSIFDDLLDSASELAAPGVLRFEDIEIDSRGVAAAGGARVDAIAALLVRALRVDPPPAALPMLARAAEARDGEQLRVWIRSALGAPASYDEVLRAVGLNPLGEAPAPEHQDFDLPILSAISSLPAPAEETPTALPVELPASDPPPRAASNPRPKREVIRHQLHRPSVSVEVAPAARPRSRPIDDPRHTLIIPDDRPHWGAWIFVIVLVGVGVLFWLRYL